MRWGPQKNLLKGEVEGGLSSTVGVWTGGGFASSHVFSRVKIPVKTGNRQLSGRAVLGELLLSKSTRVDQLVATED